MSDRVLPSAVQVTESAPRAVERSPADLLRLVVAVVLTLLFLLLEWLAGDALVTFVSDLTQGLAAIPVWILDIVVVGTRILAVVLLVAGVVAVVGHGRWRPGLAVLLAAVVAAVVAAAFNSFGPSTAPAAVEIHDGAWLLSRPEFPSAPGLAAAAAAVTAAAPWLSRAWRRAAWVLVLGLAVTRLVTAPISFDSLRSVLLGWVIGAAVVVALGGPSRRPRGRDIAAGLAAVGVPLAQLEQASLDARGSTPYFAVGANGARLFVKALGDDERSADLLFRLYRSLLRRDLGDERPFSSLRRAVEHEALVALAASGNGIRTPRFVALASAEPNAFVLAYEAVDGKSLDRLEIADVTDEVVAAIWQQVAIMRAHRIAHRDLRLANIFLGADGQIWMIDFGFSELAASDLLLANDVAELLASSSLQIGPERATAQGLAALGPVGLGTALDRLRPWALSGATRTGLGEHPGALDALRATVAASVGDG